MANNDKENKIKKFTKEAIGKTLNQFNKEIGMTNLVEVNKNQDRMLNGILSQINDENTEKTEKSNVITLDNSTDGIVELKEIQGDTNVNVSKIEEDMPITHNIGDKEGNVFNLNEVTQGAISIGEIQGNTMVNCNKDDKKELVLMKDLSTQGENNIVITEGVDGGLVDVALEGNTLVNVSKTKDDYITPSIEDKADQGSVISLPEVSEGYIHIDGIEGNTLVNYCTDGAKEMTLNGDIDVEGTFVTTTEGVDNGLVDVMCEGNTLVNLKLNSGEKCYVAWQNSDTVDFFTLNENSCYHLKGEIVETSSVLKFGWCYGALGKIKTELLKPNTTYTLILNNSYDWIRDFSLMEGSATNIHHKTNRKISKNIYTITTKDSFEGLDANRIILYGHIDGDYKGKVDCSVVAMLEGDWSEKEIPTEFFEGMKSVGQDDTNGHKIEILSQNNLMDFNSENWESGSIDGISGNLTNSNSRVRTKNFYTLPSGGKLYSQQKGLYKLAIRFYDKDYNIIDGKDTPYQGFIGVDSFTIPTGAIYYKLVCANNNNDSLAIYPYNVVDCESILYTNSNKKEILLNEPLRGLPNGTKDRIVKIGGKWYIERNCVLHTFNGSEDWSLAQGTFSFIQIQLKGIKPYQSFIVCDKLPVRIDGTDDMIGLGRKNICGIQSTYTTEMIRIRVGDLSQTLEDSKTWLANNNVSAIFELATPTYEPLEVAPELSTYTDVTHISNNSLIPCSMKIKNSGYNAIIKPSTLYTVALDTDKSGTIGMNLGGAEVTTTNNVATITTPATLSDDSLRIYGKGIKANKVRLLEGDKTNWIPQYFEGMKSSFEDKVQEDGSYKMEILMNNENLFDLQRLAPKYNNNTLELVENGFIMTVPSGTMHSRIDYSLQNLNKNKTYRLSYKVEVLEYKEGANINNDYIGYCTGCKWYPIKSNNYTADITLSSKVIAFHNSNLNGITKVKFYDIQIKEVGRSTVNNFISHKSNKIQFSSIEPLRSVDKNIKDKLIFKDGKLMIERNCGKTLLDGTEIWNKNIHEGNSSKNRIRVSGASEKMIGYKHQGKLCVSNITNSTDTGYDVNFMNICGLHERLLYVYIPRKVLGLAPTDNDATSIRDKWLSWLRNNNIDVVYELAEPTYEEIPFELQKIILESYDNGTLFIDTNIPPTKVSFNCFEEELTYLYPSTSYTVQFISDKAITADITLGGTSLLAQNIVKGLNRISITTPSELVDNKLVINGVGAKISEVVVTDTDREFGYFEGMKSVGECEGLQVKSRNKNLFNIDEFEDGKYISQVSGIIINDSSRSYNNNYISINSNVLYFKQIQALEQMAIHCYDINKNWLGCRVTGKTLNAVNHLFNNTKYIRLAYAKLKSEYKDNNIYLSETDSNYIPHQSNTQQLTHEPLRAVGDVKDRYVLIDGKWYIERNWGIDNNLSLREWTAYPLNDECPNVIGFYCSNPNMRPYGSALICDKFKSLDRDAFPGRLTLNDEVISRASGDAPYFKMSINRDRLQTLDVVGFKKWLSENDVSIIYLLASPTYEPIDYNPLEVYSEVTHITTNSTIPTNIVVKNHGYNCILKPSTKYTIASNLGLNTVTTGAYIGDSCLRFYDTDTSDITTMKNVLVLEGDWTTKPDLVPNNFSGIESAFEQELVTDEADEHYGKYKAEVKVVGKNKFDGKMAVGTILSDTGVANSYESESHSVNYIPVFPGQKITFSYNATTNIALRFYGKNKEYLGTHLDLLNILYVKSGTTITIPEGVYYLRFKIISKDLTIQYQIEEGEVATPYEPYKESNITFYIDEPLRAVGDVKDRLYTDNHKIIVERNCGEITFDGSVDENWRIHQLDTNVIQFTTLKPKNIYTQSARCDNFIVTDSNRGRSFEMYIGISNFNFMLPLFFTLDDFKQWLQDNPTTIVYQLAEPVYEEVGYSSNRLILNTFNNESFNNSTLFLDTNISPKLSFKPLWEELVYVKSNTKYYIQFNAVGSGEVVINLGGTEITTEIVEGYNCIPITTPSESTNLMTISGQGITINEVVVSEVICGGYYKGLQSCFEEHMENGKYRILLRSIALDGSKVNGIKLYINEPLRGVKDAKDRLCIKDGKLMVERKCGSVILDGSNDEYWVKYSINTSEYNTTDKTSIFRFYIPDKKIGYNTSYCNNFSNCGDHTAFSVNSCRPGTYTDHLDINAIYIDFGNNNSYSVNDFKQWLQDNPTTVAYQLAEPIYEEVTNEYGLPIVFEGYENGIVYIDSAVTPTTHIKYTSNNQLATTLSEAEEQNIATQEDINMNVITYMMDIDMMVTKMEMSNDISVMAVRRDNSNENMLDRMSEEDKKVYRDNTVVMLEKMITAKALEKEDIEGRINMYYNKNRISKEQYEYLKSLL